MWRPVAHVAGGALLQARPAAHPAGGAELQARPASHPGGWGSLAGSACGASLAARAGHPLERAHKRALDRRRRPAPTWPDRRGCARTDLKRSARAHPVAASLRLTSSKRRRASGPFRRVRGVWGCCGFGRHGRREELALAGRLRAADTRRWTRKQTPRTRDEGPLARPSLRCQAQAGRAGLCRSGPFPGPLRQIPAIRPAGAGRRRNSPTGAPKGPLSRVTGRSGERRAAGRVCESAPPCKGAKWDDPTSSPAPQGREVGRPHEKPRPAGARGGTHPPGTRPNRRITSPAQ